MIHQPQKIQSPADHVSCDAVAERREPPSPPGRRSRALAILKMGAIALPILVTAAYGIFEWDMIKQRSEATARQDARLVRDYARRLIETQQVLLTAAAQGVREVYSSGPDPAAANRLLAETAASAGQIVRIALIAPDGDTLLSSSREAGGTDVGDPDYLEGALSAPGIFIDRLVIRPEGIDALLVAQAALGGPASGVWTTAVDIAAVTDFLREVSPDAEGAASLLRADGRVLARHVPMVDSVVLEADHPAMRGIAVSDSGTFWTQAVSDGIRRYYAYERVDELPLYAVAGVAQTNLLREWLRRVGLMAGVSGLLGLAMYQLSRSAETAQSRAIERERRIAAERTAEARDVILRELNHRIKNSLNMINGLILLQEGRPGGPDLREISSRVIAIASIHDLLHQSADNLNIDLAALVRQICASRAIVPPESDVEVSCETSTLSVSADVATPLALCLVELVTNALKHAFAGGGGRIDVSLAYPVAGDRDQARLLVEDDGRGLPPEAARDSGLRLVAALVRQVGGTLDIDGRDGSRFEIMFDPAGRVA